MSVTRRLGSPRRAGLSPTVAVDAAIVCADIPVAGADGRLTCRLRAIYRTSDPLVVTFVVHAPSGATVTEALVLRSDLAAVLRSQYVASGPIALAQAEGRQIQLVFTEGSAHFGVALPRDLVEDFLETTRSLVGTDDGAEAEACTAAAAALVCAAVPDRSVRGPAGASR